MEAETKKKGFSATMSDVFRKPGQPASEFMKELKDLNSEARVWYWQELQKAGFECDRPLGT